MRFVRKIWRLTAIWIWFLLIALLAVPGLFRGRAGIRTNSRLAQWWAAGIARIWHIRIRKEGDWSSFAGGMVISNHQSYLDILVEGALFPIRFMPKAEIRHWPVLGWLLALNRPIWINRNARLESRKVNDEIRRSLEENLTLVAYAEGTTSDGGGLLPFKSTPFEMICRNGGAFTPVLLRYAPTKDGYPTAWYGNMTLLPHVWHMLGEPEITVTARLLPPVTALEGEDRKALAVRARTIMNDVYRSMKDEVE
ncbi:MAG: 1-acyl-sn-glycerol-3-phosphate acyltransferase [Lentisphaeria bacterium]|nr:1-acyl-sn-glycerol-3-phosphate acyltransferase [Lentisphaeria bacterium]